MKPTARIGSIGLAVVCSLLVVASVQGQEELYQRGNQLYQADDFQGAAEAYSAILEGGYESAALYYNLGNAFFKAGELGLSILNYERALRLDPRDPDTRANLELARSLTTDAIDPLPRFWVLSVLAWWVNLLPLGGLHLLLAFIYLVGGGGLCVRVLSKGPGRRRAGAWVAGAAGAGILLFGATLLAREGVIGAADWGIVMVEEVAVQSAPSAEDDLTLFHIHEGTRVRMDQRTEEWTEIVLADGKVGWVPTDSLESI